MTAVAVEPPAAALTLTDFEKLATYAARRWRGRLDFLDARQEAFAAMWRAMPYYRPGAGTKLSGWIIIAARRRLEQLRREAGLIRRPRCPHDAPIIACGDALDAVAAAPGDDPGARLDLAKALATLDSRELEVLEAHVVRGETLGSIGGKLGMTGERCRQIEAQALEKLREALEGEA